MAIRLLVPAPPHPPRGGGVRVSRGRRGVMKNLGFYVSAIVGTVPLKLATK